MSKLKTFNKTYITLFVHVLLCTIAVVEANQVDVGSGSFRHFSPKEIFYQHPTTCQIKL